MSNLQMSDLNSRIASFDLWYQKEKIQHGDADIDNCQKRNHVEFSSSTSLLKLARAGFYYSEDEGVKCFQCGVEFHSWDKESPVAVHRILNPDCHFLNPNNRDAVTETLFNIPATPSTSDSITYNNSCSRSHQPSDDEATPEKCPGRQHNRNSNLLNDGSTPDRNFQRDETPPSRNTQSMVDRTEVENIRRNLFLGADDTNRVNSGSEIFNLNDLNNPFSSLGMVWNHSDDYTGRIIHPKVGDKKLMVRESFRILTFPDPTDQKAEEWARNGFRYQNKDSVRHLEEDCVQCVYCGGRSSFNENDIEKTHKRISPKGRNLCPMISGIDVGDVTRELEEFVRIKLCHKNNVMLSERNAYPVYHPHYNSFEQRLESFQYWPDQYKPNKNQLAAAGFFHTGVSTKVVCFCCGVAILNWERKADSWQQHALVSPTCLFILHEKGQEFITGMARIKKLVQLDPSVTERVCKIGNLVVPDPYPPTLTRDQLTAYTSCGYTTQLLFHLVEKLFYQTCGRYPNISMLKAAVLADGELKMHVDDLDLHKEVIEKNAKQLDQIEHVMTAKDQLTKSTVATINQVHNLQLNNKDREIVQERQQCEQIVQQKDQQLNLQLNLKDQIVHQHKQQLHQHKQKLHQKDQQLSQKNRQNLFLHCTRQQLRSQLEEKDSIIDQQYGQLENLNSRLLTAVSRHEEREATLVQERDEYRTLAQAIELKKQEIEDEIKKCERELSLLGNEYSRVKKEGRGDRRREDSNRICLFCLEEDKTVMFEPCRHICCCTSCLPEFKNKPCPICRTPIQGSQVVFLI